MTLHEHEIAVQKLRTAFELHEAGVEMMRQKLRRENPDLEEDAIEKLLAKWLHHRPGAEHGDAEGRPVNRPDETLTT